MDWLMQIRLRLLNMGCSTSVIGKDGEFWLHGGVLGQESVFVEL